MSVEPLLSDITHRFFPVPKAIYLNFFFKAAFGASANRADDSPFWFFLISKRRGSLSERLILGLVQVFGGFDGRTVSAVASVIYGLAVWGRTEKPYVTKF